MSTKKTEEEFDYQAFAKQHKPDPKKLHRGRAAREQRRATAKERITIRIDEDVLAQFRDLAPDGRGYQALINRALREWLTAQGVKELIRSELHDVVKKAVS